MSEGRIMSSFKQIELVLTSRLGAQGKGAKEKLESVEALLPFELIRDIRYLAGVRNKVAHEDHEHHDEQGYVRKAEGVIAAIQRIADQREEQARMAQAQGTPSSAPPPPRIQIVREINAAAATGFLMLGVAIGVGGIKLLNNESEIQRRRADLAERGLATQAYQSKSTLQALEESKRKVEGLELELRSARATAAANAEAARTSAARNAVPTRPTLPSTLTSGASEALGPAAMDEAKKSRIASSATSTARHTVISPVEIPITVVSFKIARGHFSQLEPVLRVSITNNEPYTLSGIGFSGAIYLDGADTPAAQSSERVWSAYFGSQGLRSGQSQTLDLDLRTQHEFQWATPDILNANSHRLALRVSDVRNGSNQLVALPK